MAKNIDTSLKPGLSASYILVTGVGQREGYGYYTARPVNMAVLYCIKAVESVPAEERYSVEETRIGAWTDGTPLYQAVHFGKVAGSAGAWIPLFSIQDMGTLVDFSGIMYKDGIQAVIPNCFTSISYRNEGLSFITPSDPWFIGADFIITVKYTKTAGSFVSKKVGMRG